MATMESGAPPAPLQGRAGEEKAPVWLLPLILLAGAGLRAFGLARFPFEQDELYTAIEARHLFDSPLNPGIEARPLYYLLQHPLLEIWPVEHVTMRILPFVFGIAGIWVTWILAHRVSGRVAAGVAATLIAVSPWHLHASGMARYWSLIYLLAACFYLFVLDGYRTDRRTYHLAALGALLLGTATHPTFLFPAFGVALGITLVRDDGRLGWRWPSQSAWIHLWLPFLAALALAYLALKLTGEEGAVRNWSGRGWLGTLRLIPAIVEWATPLLFATGALGALVLFVGRPDPRRRRWGAAATVGVILGIGLLVAASTTTDVYADYAMSVLPLAVVSAGALVALAAERSRIHSGVFGGLATLLLVAGILPSVVSHFSDGTRFDYRPAFERIAARAPEAPVLTAPIILQRHYAPELNGIELQMNRPFLDRQLAQAGSFWAIIPVRRYGVWQDTTGEVADWVAANCRLRGSHENPRLDFRVYRTDLYWCEAP